MGKRKQSKIEIFKKLQSMKKSYFTVADLEKVFDLERRSLYVTLNRWVEEDLLKRLRRGIYVVSGSEGKIERIANQLYFPSYISFESALAKFGIMDQIPYTLTFATPKKSKKIILGGKEIQYRQMKKELFFGYKTEGKILIAEPEKAFLDQVYLYSLGKTSLNIKEWNLSNLNKKKILNFLKPYPKKVKQIFKKIRC